jgi:hypothetical protein
MHDGDPDDPLLDVEPPDEKGSGRGFVPEFMRKVAVAGLGALFMTEEGIRGLASQLKLPKEALSFILGQAEKTKDELGRILSEELRRFLQSEKIKDEFLRLIAGMTVEIKAEVRLVPDKIRRAEQDAERENEAGGEPSSSGANASPAAGIDLSIQDISARRSRKKKT